MESSWLRAKLKAHKITQKSLGEAIGLTQDKVNKVLAHVRLLSPIEALKAADFLRQYGIPKAETLRALMGKEAELLGASVMSESAGAGYQAVAATAPSTPSTPAGNITVIGNSGAAGEIFPAHSESYVSGVPYTGQHRLCAVKITGSALELVYHDGDMLYFEDHGMLDSSLLGKECVACLEDGRIFIRTLRQGGFPATYRLESHNSGPIENVRIRWASRIYWVKRA